MTCALMPVLLSLSFVYLKVLLPSYELFYGSYLLIADLRSSRLIGGCRCLKRVRGWLDLKRKDVIPLIPSYAANVSI